MITSLLSKLVKDRRGTSAVEMGLILAFMFLAMLVALGNFAAANTQTWNTVASKSASAIAASS